MVNNTQNREESFKRLATLRTNKALTAIRQLTNLTSYNYPYNVEHWTKIQNALGNAVTTLENGITKRATGQQEAKTDSAFTL